MKVSYAFLSFHLTFPQKTSPFKNHQSAFLLKFTLQEIEVSFPGTTGWMTSILQMSPHGEDLKM
jgi:hypothetical protein